jgi:hypothetical protein
MNSNDVFYICDNILLNDYYINNLYNIINYLSNNNLYLYKLLYFELNKIINKYSYIYELKCKIIIINKILYNYYN